MTTTELGARLQTTEYGLSALRRKLMKALKVTTGAMPDEINHLDEIIAYVRDLRDENQAMIAETLARRTGCTPSDAAPIARDTPHNGARAAVTVYETGRGIDGVPSRWVGTL